MRTTHECIDQNSFLTLSEIILEKHCFKVYQHILVQTFCGVKAIPSKDLKRGHQIVSAHIADGTEFFDGCGQVVTHDDNGKNKACLTIETTIGNKTVELPIL